MKLLKIFLTICLYISIGWTTSASADEIDDYRISADDQISITVFNEADLSIKKVRVSGNGTISMPLLGQVAIEGHTVTEVEEKTTKLLLDGYLKKPSVTVTITEYRPFYINGEIKKSGSYPYRKGLTIEKAVALAGGFTERASRSTISLVSESDKRFVKAVALSDKIKPGDVITVSESFF
ncbi:MAG: polysaccharide export protein [Colwellia sp.]|nr:polysaccharide export protein [Colwellia sp.]